MVQPSFLDEETEAQICKMTCSLVAELQEESEEGEERLCNYCGHLLGGQVHSTHLNLYKHAHTHTHTRYSIPVTILGWWY